jgi:hypothetical protein
VSLMLSPQFLRAKMREFFASDQSKGKSSTHACCSIVLSAPKILGSHLPR